MALDKSITRLGVTAGLAGLVLTSACSSSSAGPRLPSCGAHGTQLILAVAQYNSIDPATDSGCVTFPANTSPDTAEYLVLPWSAGGTPGSSTPFTLQSATPQAVIAMQQIAQLAPALSGGARSAQGPVAVAFDRFLRESARAGRYSSPARSAGGAGSVSRASLAGPPTVESSARSRCAPTRRARPSIMSVPSRAPWAPTSPSMWIRWRRHLG